MFIPVHNPRPTPQATELSQRIGATIREYMQRNPGLAESDVRMALELARQKARGGGFGDRTAIAAAIGLLMLVAGLGTFFYVERSSGGSVPLVGVVIGVLGVVGAMVAIKGRR